MSERLYEELKKVMEKHGADEYVLAFRSKKGVAVTIHGSDIDVVYLKDVLCREVERAVFGDKKRREVEG